MFVFLMVFIKTSNLTQRNNELCYKSNNISFFISSTFVCSYKNLYRGSIFVVLIAYKQAILLAWIFSIVSSPQWEHLILTIFYIFGWFYTWNINSCLSNFVKHSLLSSLNFFQRSPPLKFSVASKNRLIKVFPAFSKIFLLFAFGLSLWNNT